VQSPFPSSPQPINSAEALKAAIAYHQAGHLDQAEQLYRQILAQQPQQVDALSLMGVIACQRDKLEEGMALYRQALALQPNHRQARENLNLALWKLGKKQIDEAIANLNWIVNFEPRNEQAQKTLANIYQEQGMLEQALHHYQQALAANPTSADVLNRIGVVLQYQGKPNLAAHFHRQALIHQPHNVDALISLAKAVLDQGKVDDGLAYINQALSINPTHPIARYNRALILLQKGDFQQGFPEYEWRLKTADFPPCPFKQPIWDGSNFSGKTLLLHAEQGLGDTIQFIRYVPLVTERGGRVILTCHQPLMRLFSSLPGIDQFIPLGMPLPAFDTYAPLLSLPGILGTTLDTVPHQVPYLRPPRVNLELPTLATTSPAAFSGSSNSKQPKSTIQNPKLKVGLVWSGGNLYKHNQTRSFSLQEFHSLLDVPEVSFYSLQKGIPQLEIAELGWQSRLIDLSEQLQDMADTADAIAQLDLVITVDTSVAHLAGALATPVWVLLAHVADWRWLLNRQDSPWYPTMRLFRQSHPGDWQGVMQRVVEALKEARDKS
jgi:Tfp pilus assembly protein PilF